jgi:hypothetical protein
VQALIHPDNIASRKLVERHGFRREGLLRDNPRVVEMLFALLETDGAANPLDDTPRSSLPSINGQWQRIALWGFLHHGKGVAVRIVEERRPQIVVVHPRDQMRRMG